MTTSYLWSIKYSLDVEGARPMLVKVVADTIHGAIMLVEESDDRDVIVSEVVLVDTVYYKPGETT